MLHSVFRTILGEEPLSIFESTEDWASYAKGASVSNQKWYQNQHGVAAIGQEMDAEAFRATISESWLWLDFLSIPQTVNCKTEQETQAVLAQQAAAISSIPEYVSRATNFWVCAPSSAKHVDTAQMCDYATWHSRGWCRMEETVMIVTRSGDGRPLYIDGPVGQPPRVRCSDVIDWLVVDSQRQNAVCTGAFSCCRLNHVVTSADGHKVAIPCDKVRLHEVLSSLIARQLASLRATFEADDATPWEGGGSALIRHSVQGDKSWMRYVFLKYASTRLLATSLEEPFVSGYQESEGWHPVCSRPFEKLTREDLTAMAVDSGHASPSIGFVSELHAIFLTPGCAGVGALPLLRYMHEKEGVALDDVRSGRSALMNASATGCLSVVRYILERVSKAHVDWTSPDSGLSAMSLAAYGDHCSVLSVLIESGANLNVTRTNGRTSLHQAALTGSVGAIKLLLTRGADPNLRDHAGETALDVALKRGYSSQKYAEIEEVLRHAMAS